MYSITVIKLHYIFITTDEIKEKVRAFLEDFSLITIASLTGWDYIQSALATVA